MDETPIILLVKNEKEVTVKSCKENEVFSVYDSDKRYL